MKTKIIITIGGVYSSLGKGIISSSIGRILVEMKQKVSMMKLDPYLNVDPGTLSPYQHGEVFVTYDGAETDLDLGNYERFTNKKMSRMSSITSGRIYSEVIEKERARGYGGKTVQVIPHITNAIKDKIYKIMEVEQPDFLLIEVGGTVGDIESIPFVEALSQFISEYGKQNVLPIFCSPLIYISTSQEIKTKPTQHAFREICSLGVWPELIILRHTENVDDEIIQKISLNCHINKKRIFVSPNLESIYFLPIELYKQGIQKEIFEYFDLKLPNGNINNWENYVKLIKNAKDKVKIAMVGKYIKLHDSYASLEQALKLATWEQKKQLEINWIEADSLNSKNVDKILKNHDGILIPGGFGDRGFEGKMEAVKYARTKQIPYLGICLGMQIATIEFARNVLNWQDANTTEFDPKTTHPIFDYIDGRMRLGEQACLITDSSSKAIKMYKNKLIYERHRHRYEFNNKYLEEYKNKGFSFTAFSNDQEKTAEIIEIKKHPFFVGVQFHPEFSSWPNNVDPVIFNFITAAIKNK